jgi:ammonia channel protein AmtB
MSASVIFYYAFSVLIGKQKKMEIKGSTIGTLAGAIMYGPIAGTCQNIGASIAVGLFAGIISAFFF